ncbi:MAG: SpoIIE family protein phosphatase [Peptococcaceae bacterium]|nr:SpoIIE family protein phosphatase [Peptococcaceae bacterium]
MARNPNVLLVDDYEVNLELLEAYLDLSGIPMNLYKASNCAEAYDWIQKVSLDLILLDVMLPDGSGYDVCKNLKAVQQYRGIPVIILTALNDKQSMLEGLKAGADEFLTKPVDSHELILRVKNLLKMKEIANDLDDRYSQLHRELVIATELQKSFLPRSVPKYDNVDIEVLYKPSSYIGGDFYDFIRIDENHLGVLICDVKGHGVASAMITATIKFQLNDLKQYYLEPDKLLEQLNNRLELFFSSTGNDYFVTAVYGVLHLDDVTFCYSNAGHSYPCLCSRDGLTLLENQQGLPLGILPGMGYDQQSVTLTRGQELFLYTDGIYEIELRGKAARSCSSLTEFFEGEEEQPDIRQIHELQEEIYRYTATHQIADDINYIAIRLNEQEE